jgi:protein-tyrosine phosphatase
MTHIFLLRALTRDSPGELQEIIPRLFLGSIDQAFDPRTISKFKITHIVNVCQSENVFEFGIESALERVKKLELLPEFTEFQTPRYIRVSIADDPSQNLIDHFERVFAFIDDAFLSDSSRILVHCHAGISRSSSVVIGYLMHRLDWTLDEAFMLVQKKRPKIRPNPGFSAQLIEFHQKKYDGDVDGYEKFYSKIAHVGQEI